MKRLITVVLTALLFSASNFALADNATTVGRYLTVEKQALNAQSDLLQQTFQVRFPNQIKTIGDAIHYLLRFSGYSLIDNTRLSKEAQAVISQPLPSVDRQLGTMSLQDGLLTLAGQPFGLIVDPVHRLISLRLKPAYQTIYKR